MSRNAFKSLEDDYNREQFEREERQIDRELQTAHKRLNQPTYDDLLRQVMTLTAERDEWRDAFLELRKLTHVPEC